MPYSTTYYLNDVTVTQQQVLASNAVLHHLLPERCDSDTIRSLRNFQPFPLIRARTNKFHESFLPCCLEHFT